MRSTELAEGEWEEGANRRIRSVELDKLEGAARDGKLNGETGTPRRVDELMEAYPFGLIVAQPRRGAAVTIVRSVPALDHCVCVVRRCYFALDPTTQTTG